MTILQDIISPRDEKKLTIEAPIADGQLKVYLVVDSVSNIVHDFQTTPTSNPVEDGSVIADHIDKQPKILSFEGIMTESPISIAQVLANNVAGAVSTIGGASGTLAGTLFTGAAAVLGGTLLNEDASTRPKNAHDALRFLQENSVLVTLQTGLEVYTNMSLTSYSPKQTITSGRALVFTATFKEVVIVQSESVAIPDRILDASVKNSASSVQGKGNKTSSETSVQSQSVLSQITGIGA